MTSKPLVSEHRFVQVDVFTDHVFGGNPLAVFFDASDLTGEQMQAIAREMNLSETVFLLPATRDDCIARARIFTPGTELPFAGHPTIGTAFVLATDGRVPSGATEFALEERIGPVPIRLEGSPDAPDFIWMQHQPASFDEPLAEPERVLAALGLETDDRSGDLPLQVGSTGVPFLYLPLRDREVVDRARMDEVAYLAALGNPNPAPGAFIFAPELEDGDDEHRVYSRMLGTHSLFVGEDPATGSASGPLGAYLVKEGIFAPDDGQTRIVSEQGTKMGRQSFIHITVRQNGDGSGQIEVGGSTVPVLEGTLRLR